MQHGKTKWSPNCLTLICEVGLIILWFEARPDHVRIVASKAYWCTVQLKRDGTRWRTGGEVRGKLANGVGSQYSSHYLGTWCIQHYYRWCAHLGLPAVDWTDVPADLNGLVRCAEKQNLVSARVTSHFKRSLLSCPRTSVFQGNLTKDEMTTPNMPRHSQPPSANQPQTLIILHSESRTQMLKTHHT